MLSRSVNVLILIFALTLWAIALRPITVVELVQPQSHAAQAKDNEEVKRLCDEDQADRTPPEGKPIDWTKVGPRDKARLKRVKEIYTQNLLQTANDYDRAATVLQHGDVPEDFLLAHEFWVVAISKGKNDKDTLSLAAASEDRYLMGIGRPQRFGTQLRSIDNGPIQLYQVDPGVTDELRRMMGGRSLAEIKARVAEMNKK
ncbi:MAG TPA: hypothetical protein VJS64_19265 [Pyrinomonadaceae bacterium]|nr:hypothetical protein [Pyrinomonadaceae bacterium]